MDHDQAVRLWVVPVGPGRAEPSTLQRRLRSSFQVLDRAEQERAASFRSEADGARYRRAHVALRQILAEELGVGPGEIAYGRHRCPRCGGPHGRPMLVHPSAPVQFSLATSGDIAMVALCPAPVGVDVERTADAETVAWVGTLLHPAERAEIIQAPPAQRPAAFTTIWTRKEAFRKARGDGLADDLASDYLGADAAQPDAPPGWQITSVPVAEPYQAAVAVARAAAVGEDRAVRTVVWDATLR